MRACKPRCSLILACLAVSSAQVASEKWRQQNDRGNRFEGLIEVPASLPDLELLSFVAHWEPFERGATLRVLFYLPVEMPVVVESRELREQRQYWMESKPRSWRRGAWNEFGPWPTTEVIAREGIASDNLGVVVRPRGEAWASTILPALVYHQHRPESVNRYSLYIRPNTTLRTVQYSADRVSDAKTVDLAKGMLVSEKIAGEPFLIDLDFTGVKSGPVRLIISGTFKNRTGGPVRKYEFYHRARVD
ncbi:MAG: hypothetical protein NTW28_05915 [Candidatus Solibacter sp.]|nr:hypothetical protein [Candidatus Solibacter sp.]